MTDVLEETEADTEQTEEVAKAMLPPEPEQIAADDPLARPMWAVIARTAIQQGADSYYETIAQELGAPNIQSLKESGDLIGTAKSKYRIILTVTKSSMDDGGKATPAEIRDHLRRMLKRNDNSLMNVVEHRSLDIDWSTLPAEPKVVTTFDPETNPF